LAKAAGTVGRVARGVVWADTARNVVMAGEGTIEAYKHGLNWENGLKIFGGLLGARGNIGALNQIGQAGKVGRGILAAEKGLHQATERVLSTAIHGILPKIPIVGRLHDPVSWAVNKLGFKVCFSGRTKLLARGKWGKGYKRIDEITVDDEVASRNEFDPNGEIV